MFVIHLPLLFEIYFSKPMRNAWLLKRIVKKNGTYSISIYIYAILCLFILMVNSKLLVLTLVGILTLAAVSLAMSMHYVNAQQPPSSSTTPTAPTTAAAGNNTAGSANAGGLKFFIKLANNNTSQQTQR